MLGITIENPPSITVDNKKKNPKAFSVRCNSKQGGSRQIPQHSSKKETVNKRMSSLRPPSFAKKQKPERDSSQEMAPFGRKSVIIKSKYSTNVANPTKFDSDLEPDNASNCSKKSSSGQ